ncbi:thionin BTH7-like [Panicum virgatum]|uniref:Acidic protein n=1 Tax=Panicum virgatum TaxID=38727 RepID=A0A8T0Q9G0_PANVG|nr:thionin BTH7-like [Panicum virgatum]KAG2571481.1 hypothetical protein PVAP13_7KG379300 [Panicum virgatum]
MGIISKVLMCVLMLGLVLQLAQVEGKSCCKNTAARLCYNTCRFPTPKPPREVCASLCGCIIQKEPICKPPYPSFNLFRDSEEPVSIQYCSMGCRSSVCANMSINDVDGSNGMETIVERCGQGCDQFCKGYASIESSVDA